MASLQSVWVSGRGAQKELDEAKLRFAAAEVLDLNFHRFHRDKVRTTFTVLQ